MSKEVLPMSPVFNSNLPSPAPSGPVAAGGWAVPPEEGKAQGRSVFFLFGETREDAGLQNAFHHHRLGFHGGCQTGKPGDGAALGLVVAVR